MRSQLREAKDQRPAGPSQVSVPAESAEHQRQLQQQKKRVEELEQELREAKASAAKLKALNNSDQEQGVAQQQFIDQVQAQLDSEK